MSAAVTAARPLRAFMTADAVGGVWTYALDAAAGLRAHDVETTLAVLGPAPSDDQRRAAEAAGVALIETGLPLDWVATLPEEVEDAAWAVARLAVEAAPDIIHLNSPAPAARAAFPAPIVTVAHSCVATWWDAVRGGALPPDFAWRADLTRRGYVRASALLAPTAAFADATARLYGLSEAPVVVRNGRRASPPAEEDPAAFVFTAGRLWDEGKNIAALDRAASRVPVSVRAAGSCEGPNGARIHLAHVEALGRLSDAEIARELAARPIFVSSARYEPFGLAALEAAQAGCALVLADIPTFRELWDGAALFVRPDDDEGLSRSIEALLSDPASRARLAAAARQRAGAYTLDAMSAGIARVYRSVLKSRAMENAAA